jgi:hypothetical protein
MSKDFRLVISGCRDYNNYTQLSSEIDSFLQHNAVGYSVIIVSGGADGADALGEKYAREHGLKIERFHANWEVYGSSAGPIRNKQMAEAADAAIVFWDGKSSGTADMIQRAKNANIPCKIINV